MRGYGQKGKTAEVCVCVCLKNKNRREQQQKGVVRGTKWHRRLPLPAALTFSRLASVWRRCSTNRAAMAPTARDPEDDVSDASKPPPGRGRFPWPVRSIPLPGAV
jgi:hypothetical protein